MMHLNGKAALVTGGGTGTGLAITKMLVDAGAKVTITGRRAEVLETVAKDEPNISTYVGDVTSETDVAQMVEAAGNPQIVVANAGIANSKPLLKTSKAEFESIIATNLTGVFLTLREGFKGMAGYDWGRLIVISSVAGLRGGPYIAPYAASKHGTMGLVRSIALEIAKSGVTCNAICPSYIDTEMTDRSIANVVDKTGKSPSDAKAYFEKLSPMGRLIPAADVAQMVMWLCGPNSSMVNGQPLTISGGET